MRVFFLFLNACVLWYCKHGTPCSGFSIEALPAANEWNCIDWRFVRLTVWQSRVRLLYWIPSHNLIVLILTNNIRVCFLRNRLTCKRCSKLVPCRSYYYYAVYSPCIVIVIAYCFCILWIANGISALSIRRYIILFYGPTVVYDASVLIAFSNFQVLWKKSLPFIIFMIKKLIRFPYEKYYGKCE